MRVSTTIAQLISSGGFYGAENMLANLLEALQELEADVVLYVLDNTHNSHLEIAARAEGCGIPVRKLTCRGRFDGSVIKTLRESLIADGVSVLHTHGYKADLYGYLAARATGTTLISTCHNWTKASLPLRIYCLADKRVLRSFDSVAAVSPQVAEELTSSGVDRTRVRMIANGVPMCQVPAERINSVEEECVTIGMATRLVEEKGIADLLQVVFQRSGASTNIRLVIAGEGPLRGQFEAQARALGIADRTTFLGFVADMQAFYASIDVFVLPSLREGLPMSLLEAMAAGKAVVASSVGGIPGVVLHDHSGLLIDPGDVAALGSCVDLLANDAGLRSRLGQGAHARISESYSARAMAKQYLALYGESAERGKVKAQLTSSPEPFYGAEGQ